MPTSRKPARKRPGKRISIRLDANVHRKLERLASKRRQKPADVVRAAVQQLVSEKPETPSAYDLASRIGLIGCGNKAPCDLSTNPKHLEGMGQS